MVMDNTVAFFSRTRYKRWLLAKDRSEELTNKGLTATFIKYMKEVTIDVLVNETAEMTELIVKK